MAKSLDTEEFSVCVHDTERIYPSHIQSLVNHPKEHLTAAQIAKVVGKDANTLRHMARHMPERLPFPCVADPETSTVRFPKWPFLAAYGYKA